MRLAGYDYSQPGTYFITICTRDRVCRFGNVVRGAVALNSVGKMVDRAWQSLAEIPNVLLDEHIVMPNHIHGILGLLCKQDELNTVPALVGRLKSWTTVLYTQGVKYESWPRFDGYLWQRGYYETIIRNEVQMASIREYIRNNPAQWKLDENNSKPSMEGDTLVAAGHLRTGPSVDKSRGPL